MDYRRFDKVIIFLYIFSTLFFVYQHSTGISWDFSCYVLNAKYMFANGFYFEWYRAPLMPFLIGIFSVFGWLTAEYLYIIFISTLFLYSCLKISKNLKCNKRLFYAISLSPFALINGLMIGTELLSLALLQLFVAHTLERKRRSGFSLGLSFLTRYTNLIFTPLILFNKNYKKILVTLILFISTVIPWLTYNWIVSGNPLTSIANSYALNVKFRGYMFMPFNLLDVLIVIGYFLPFFLLGVFLRLKKMNKIDWIMISVILLILISYYKTPYKELRYLFSLGLPVSYFSTTFIDKIRNKKVVTLIIVILNFGIASFFFTPLYNLAPYKQIIPRLDDCMLESNVWPYFNYLGVPTDTYPWKNTLNSEIKVGKRILLFKNNVEPEYVRDEEFLSHFPIIENTAEYILLGDENKCAPRYKVDTPFLEKVMKETGTKITICEIFLPKELC